jgi:uncharacterized surface protein with fasciclin (FAS1) repeats
MKNTFLFKSALLIIAFLVITPSFVSCTMEENANAKKPSITEVIQSQSYLSTLAIALEKTGLSSTFNSQGTYTLFAPTNEAFAFFLAQNGFTSINDVPSSTLKQILLNHVIGQVVNSTDLPSAGYIKTLAIGNTSTTNNLSMFVNKSNGIVLNDMSDVTASNILASNGIIHIVSGVITLPSISDHIKANPNLSSMTEALSGAGQPAFFTTFSGTGPFTVFAPINSAFTSLNVELTGGITGVSTANMTKILRYHVATGNILAADFTDGEVISTFEAPQTFTVLLNSVLKLKDVNNRNSNVITTDIQCTNGVIHLLNKVLLPSL